jgi:hypothetical protein
MVVVESIGISQHSFHVFVHFILDFTIKIILCSEIQYLKIGQPDDKNRFFFYSKKLLRKNIDLIYLLLYIQVKNIDFL